MEIYYTFSTIEPPVSDHQNAKTKWSHTGGGRLQD